MRQLKELILGWLASFAWRLPESRRERLAMVLALVTVVGLGASLFLSKGTQLLMPGPLTSAHGAIEKCSACHTQSGGNKLSWVRGLVAGDPHADSKACLTCHKMPSDTAFNAHGATPEALKQSTERLIKVGRETPQPQAARAQEAAFPTHGMTAEGLTCATCHQEHQGGNFKLAKISNEQCRSCHVVKFDSFDGSHPKFENFPFKKRTQVIFDHAGHFGKHYPEVAKKEPAKRIPDTCSTCHDSRADKRVMAVAPFEQTCSGCHLDQIVSKERVSGPKGIAFLSLPGLDLATLKKKNAPIGEWPDASEAALTPFMKVMISRTEQGRDLIKTLDKVNLQDLSDANEAQIKAATKLAWEIKGLFHALIKGKASDVLGDLNIGGGGKLATSLVTDLTASLPRDVVVSAQQQWLPNLGVEMANRGAPREEAQAGSWSAEVTQSNVDATASQETVSREGPSAPATQQAAVTENGDVEPVEAKPEAPETPDSGPEEAKASDPPGDSKESEEAPSEDAEAEAREAARKAKLDPPVCTVHLFGQCFLYKEAPAKSDAAKSDGAGVESGASESRLGFGNDDRSSSELPPPMRAGIQVAENAAQPEEPGGPIIRRWYLPSGTSRALDSQDDEEDEKPVRRAKPAENSEAPSSKPNDAAKAGSGSKPARETEPAAAKSEDRKDAPSASKLPLGTASNQTDDLLFPTEEELRAAKASGRDAVTSTLPEEAVQKTGDAAPAGGASSAPAQASGGGASKPQKGIVPVVSIESDIEPESWAEYGGWYRQDYAIFYRPIGHKDKFIYSWLFLTGPQGQKGEATPAAAVFDFLTSKDAQGSCTKCHSVDDIQSRGRVVNFSPPKAGSKRGRFTTFIHEPHFGIMENRGCLTCHELAKDRPYLKSYEQGDPHNFASNFGEVKKELCSTCHTSNMARQDCLTCHKYHVNGVVTPVMSTKLPSQ